MRHAKQEESMTYISGGKKKQATETACGGKKLPVRMNIFQI